MQPLCKPWPSVVTHSRDATLMRALQSSIGQSSWANDVIGSNGFSSSLNGIKSSTMSLRQEPCKDRMYSLQYPTLRSRKIYALTILWWELDRFNSPQDDKDFVLWRSKYFKPSKGRGGSMGRPRFGETGCGGAGCGEAGCGGAGCGREAQQGMAGQCMARQGVAGRVWCGTVWQSGHGG